MLALQIDRLKRSQKIDRLVVATSKNPDDQSIAALCEELDVDVYRGNLNNVLDRFYQAARQYHPDHIVRLTGDCPLIDPDVVDELITFYLDKDCDYASNCRPPSYPDGLDIEVFTFSALEKAWKESVRPDEKEHVIVYIVTHPDQFRIANYKYHQDLSHLRWTVDEPEDLDFVKRVFEALYPENPNFGMRDILELLDRNPELTEINLRHKKSREHEQIEIHSDGPRQTRV